MTRIYQYSARKPCYYCGKTVAIDKEHAPPKSFFKGTGCGRLTVPSCPEHNGEKSNRDFAVLCTMLMAVESVWDKGFRASIPEPVRDAIERVRPSYGDAKRGVSMTRVLTDPPESRFDIDLPYTEGKVNILNWMTQLTAALVWTAVGSHESGSDWETARSWSPVYFQGARHRDTGSLIEWVRKNREILDFLQALEPWRQGWQPTPPYPNEIYRFEAFVGTAVIFKHFFFGNLDFYTIFETSNETKQKINDLLGPVVPVESPIG